ncbi:hypothetical protein BT69DRAFT_1330737 [Atractiella rhizophila]|nr:hypothetical protein BT69DRAFT_1330737 [Atractiella rhizophila]
MEDRYDILEVLPSLPDFPSIDTVTIIACALKLNIPSSEPRVSKSKAVYLQGCDFSYGGLSTLFKTKRSLIVLHVNPVSTVEPMDLLRFASDFEGYLSLSDLASTNNALLDLPSSVLSLFQHQKCTSCLSILGVSDGCSLSFNGKEDGRVWLAFADIIGRHSFPRIKRYSIGSNAEMLEVKTQEGRNAIQALRREVEKRDVQLELFVEFKEDDAA